MRVWASNPVDRRVGPAIAALLVGLCTLPAGCGADRLDYTEFKRIDEKVTESELQQFLRVIDSLPDKKLPKMEEIFAPLPSWNPARTLPVNELANEEQKAIDRRWAVDEIARKLKQDRTLQRVLRREQMTTEQFVGMTVTLGAALAKSRLRDQQDLDQVIHDGRKHIAKLQQDKNSFSKLTRDAQHTILRRAGYITRTDRAKRLKEVPPENVALVQKHFEKLETVFPKYLTTNPLDSIADLLEERGMPFEELKASGFDAEITWDPDRADVGTDAPDPVMTEKAITPAREPATTHQTGHTPRNNAGD